MKKNPLLIILGISALFFVVFVAISIGTLKRFTSGSAQSQKGFFAKSNHLGVIEVNGVILDSKKLLDQIDTFSDDPLIKGVILRVNSPGGAVAPSQEVYEAVKKLNVVKPVYVSMGNLAASGGYYISCGAKKIFANPGTITGSIGVIMQFADLTKLYQWAKVSPYNIKTGRYKDIGSPFREMTAEEKQMLQDMAENVLSQFRKAVSDGRHIPLEKVVALADGRIFSGSQALDVKLVDELGSISDTAAALAKEVGITEKPQLVYPSKKKSIYEKFFQEEDSETDSSASIGTLVKAFAGLLKVSGVDIGGLKSGVSSDFVGPLFLLPYAIH